MGIDFARKILSILIQNVFYKKCNLHGRNTQLKDYTFVEKESHSKTTFHSLPNKSHLNKCYTHQHRFTFSWQPSTWLYLQHDNSQGLFQLQKVPVETVSEFTFSLSTTCFAHLSEVFAMEENFSVALQTQTSCLRILEI